MNQIKASNDHKGNSYNLRIFLLMSGAVVAVGLIGFRLFILQVVNHSYYQRLAANQHGLETTISAKRGEIYLTPVASGQPVLVATNLIRNLVYANQKQITDPKAVAIKLAPILSLPSSADLAKKLTGNSGYLVLKKQLTDEVSTQIKDLKIPGIYLEPEPIRFYPENNVASQVLGFLGFKNNQRAGQYGIEEKYEKQLAGQAGFEGTQADASGGSITFSDRNFIPAVDGDDVYLTLDPAIQFKVQEVLDAAVQKHGADSGSVIVLDPASGKVLAMASAPDFDLNNYSKVPSPAIYSNSAIGADYEPGSIFKAITMAAALNEGKVTPDMTYENTGTVQVDDKLIKNSDPNVFHGLQSMITVLDESLNTGAFFAEQQIGNDTFKKYVEAFGFGKQIDFELPGVTKGNLANLNKKGNVFFATASFGQGITVTPLQMAQAYSAIANGGKMVKPFVVSKVVHPDGQVEEIKPSASQQVIDSKTASTLSAMLVDVVEKGHGKKAAVKGYYVAGKTGTAQVPFANKAGYDPNQNIGSFIGFGPVDNPKFVMIVRINNPKDVKFAESTAAPAFGEIAQFILNYLQVPPSRQ